MIDWLRITQHPETWRAIDTLLDKGCLCHDDEVFSLLHYIGSLPELWRQIKNENFSGNIEENKRLAAEFLDLAQKCEQNARARSMRIYDHETTENFKRTNQPRPTLGAFLQEFASIIEATSPDSKSTYDYSHNKLTMQQFVKREIVLYLVRSLNPESKNPTAAAARLASVVLEQAVQNKDMADLFKYYRSKHKSTESN